MDEDLTCTNYSANLFIKTFIFKRLLLRALLTALPQVVSMQIVVSFVVSKKVLQLFTDIFYKFTFLYYLALVTLLRTVPTYALLLRS